MQKRPNATKLEYRHYDLPLDFPVKALLEHRFVFPKNEIGRITYLHLHNHVEIGYNYQGCNSLVVEGKDWETVPGDISIVCPFAMHISYCKEEQAKTMPCRWEYLYVDLQQLFGDFYPQGFPMLELFTHHYPDFPNIINGSDHPDLARLVFDIFNEMRYEKENYREAVKGMLLTFFVQLARLLPQNIGVPAPQQSAILVLSPAITYISEHYMEHIEPQILAELCHISVTHFRRLFKSVMNQTPVDYIASVRIHNACKLLYETELSVLDIALQVGYNSISSFNRQFAALLDAAPKKWRDDKRKIQKKNLVYSIFDG